MTWVAVGVAGASLVSGLIGSKKAGDSAKQAQAMSEADKKWAAEQVKNQTEANRVDQTSDFGSSKWTQDPTTGKWSQTTALAAPEAARLADYRQMAADRMRAANNIDLSKPANWASGGGTFIGPQGAGGNVPTIRQPHYGPGNQLMPPPGPAGGGQMMPPPNPGTPGAPAPAAPTPIQHADVVPAGTQTMMPPTPTAPTAPTAPTGPDPQQQALADALRRQQEEQAAAANSGNGSG
jgi:hypothetical protein